jgi:hypothetical protein
MPCRACLEVNEVEQEKAFTTDDINAAVRKHLSPQKPVKVGGLDGHHAVMCGLRGEGRVTVSGRAGDLLAAFLDGPQVTLSGSAGDFTGSTMVSGTLLVEGAVGRGLCCHMVGGRARIKGRCGDGAGAMMSGGLLVLDGPVGAEPGEGMTGGTLVLVQPTKLPTQPPSDGRLLAPRGVAVTTPGLSVAELTHEEVAELQGQLEQLGVPEAAKLAGDLVRLVTPTGGRPASPEATPKDSHGFVVGPEAGQRPTEPQGPGQKVKTASERFESFAREVKGG